MLQETSRKMATASPGASSVGSVAIAPANGTTTRIGRPSRRRSSHGSKSADNGRRAYVRHDYHDHLHDPIFEPDDHDALTLEAASDGAKPRRGPRGGVVIPFPQKLNHMLASAEQDGIEDVVSWQPHGRCFVVHQPKVFVAEVMPKYFNQSKLTSFQRQLNLYGFQRLTKGKDRGGYYHEYFLCGRPDLHKKLVRIRVKGTGFKAAASPSTEPNFYSMRACSGHGSNSAGPMYVKKAMTVANSVLEEVLVDRKDDMGAFEEGAMIAAPFGSSSNFMPPLVPNSSCAHGKPSLSDDQKDFMSVNKPWLQTTAAAPATAAFSEDQQHFVSVALRQMPSPPSIELQTCAEATHWTTSMQTLGLAPITKPLPAPSALRDPFKSQPAPRPHQQQASVNVSYIWGDEHNDGTHPAYLSHTDPSALLSTLERSFELASTNQEPMTGRFTNQELPSLPIEPFGSLDGSAEDRLGESTKLQSWPVADWIGFDPLFMLDEEANQATTVSPPA